MTRAVVVGLVLAGGVAAVPAASASPGLVTERNGSLELGSSAGVTSTREQVPVVVDPALRLTGPAGRVVRGAVVRIADGASGDDELLFDDQGAISGTFAHRRLRLTGAAPARAYLQALRSVKFVHDGDEPGSPSTTRSIRFKLLDQGGAAASKTLEVVAVDDAPQVTMTDSELELAAGAGAVALDPGLRIVEPDSASLSGATVTVRGGVAGASNDALGFAAARGITGTLDSARVLTLTGAASVADYQAVLRQVTYRNTGTTAGERVVEVVVRDTSRTPGSASRRVLLTAAPPTEQPVARDDVATTRQGSGPITIAVLANDTAPAGTSLRIASVTQPLQGSVTTDGTTVSYQPAANHCNSTHGLPTYPFTYTLATGQTATVRVAVTCVEVTPSPVDDTATVAVPDTASRDEDSGVLRIDVLDNDRAGAGALALASVTQPTNGETYLEKTYVLYFAENDFCGTDEFTYTLTSGSTATVTVTSTCVDDAPVAAPDAITVAQDSGPTVVDVLGNDTDADGDVLSVESVGSATHGTATLMGGVVRYQPAAGYCTVAGEKVKPDVFTYALVGGSTATVSITVTCALPTTAAPQAKADEYAFRFGTLVVDAPGLLGNDTAGEGETLKVVGCAAGTNDPLPGQVKCDGLVSTLTVNSDGSLSFSSTLAINLRETFTYAIEDSRGRRSTAQVVINRQGPVFGF